MDRNQAREILKPRLRDYIQTITRKSKGANMYVCPLCKSGTGKNETGAFSIKNGISWKCFSCNKGGDIFDIIGEHEGILDYSEQLNRACEIYGIKVDTNFPAKKDKFQKQYKNEQYKQNFKDLFLKAPIIRRREDLVKVL